MTTVGNKFYSPDMLKAYLQHQLERADRGEITNGIMHCHCRGVASIVFNDEPGNRVRMFYAFPEHELWKNIIMDQDMTVALHPHHCDIKLSHIFGDVFNAVVEVEEHWRGKYHECLYDSKINGGKGGLERTGKMFRFKSNVHCNLRQERQQSMTAPQLHTIGTWKSRPAAWLVIEGKEWPDYRPVCYTANPVFDSTGLYEKMNPGQISTTIYGALRNL